MKVLYLTLALAALGSAQSAEPPDENGTPQAKAEKKNKPGAGKDIGGGTADVGKGAARGAGNLAKGTGKGAADIVTLHPIDGAESVGKGAASAGKDVTVGTAKGAGKVTRGVGKLFRKIF